MFGFTVLVLVSSLLCPRCQELGMTSTVFVDGFSTITCLGWTPFYDESGNYHSHDPNRSTQGAHCSNGHALRITGGNRCWCGWGFGEVITYVGEYDDPFSNLFSESQWNDSLPVVYEVVLPPQEIDSIWGSGWTNTDDDIPLMLGSSDSIVVRGDTLILYDRGVKIRFSGGHRYMYFMNDYLERDASRRSEND